MLSLFKGLSILAWAFSLPQVLLAQYFVHTGIMDSLSAPFTIEVNGAPISNVASDAQDRSQAKTGSEAALFTLNNGILQSGDWFLGRNKTEDRSFLPKPVLWFKKNEESEKVVQPVTAHQSGDTYQLQFNGAKLIAEDGNVLVDISGQEQSDVKVTVQG